LAGLKVININMKKLFIVFVFIHLFSFVASCEQTVGKVPQISERPGNIRLIKAGKLIEKPYTKIEVAHIGEGGLMGLALHPS
jgi:hypothetical protein